jgi:hypothetical protein
MAVVSTAGGRLFPAFHQPMQFRVPGKMSIVNLLILLHVPERDFTKMCNNLLEDDTLQALAGCRAANRPDCPVFGPAVNIPALTAPRTRAKYPVWTP